MSPFHRFLPLLLICLASVDVLADDIPTPPPLVWQTDYGKAYAAALDTQRMLLIHFEGTPDDPSTSQTAASLAKPKIQKLCGGYELLRIPADYEVTIGGKTTQLLKHDAFAAMGNKPGLAIVDLKHADREHYRQTVSAMPFRNSVYYSPSLTSESAIAAVLQLPAGTITQRTMILAVRLHPENPASTRGRAEPLLLSEAAGHSAYQARIGVQGHQGFDARFQRINGVLGGAAQEVVAESWPGEDLLSACFSCVKSWRGSPGHWSAVSAAQQAYGYDIRRSASGTWYATGIFAGG